MESDRERIERLKVDPANVAAQLVALTSVSDWARGMHRENFDGYLIAAAELLTRPTPDGEIGELVEAVARDQFTFQMGETNLTWESRPEYEREARMEQARHWCELPTIATALETQAADIARLREALFDWRNCWLCPVTDFEGEVERLIKETDVLIDPDEASLATRTDVR